MESWSDVKAEVGWCSWLTIIRHQCCQLVQCSMCSNDLACAEKYVEYHKICFVEHHRVTAQ